MHQGSEWTKLVSRQNPGRHYYYNIRTGESTWRAPSSKIAGHYNRMAGETAEQRKRDCAISVRNLHNWLKNMLLRSHCAEGDAVLDLCCGKGGDIFKFKHIGVSRYTGVDFADAAIQAARVRATSITFPIDLRVADLRQPLDLGPGGAQHDLVSAQFCMHYFWETEATAAAFMDNAAQHLRPGGHLVATLTDSEVLGIATSTKRCPGVAGNPLYRVRMCGGDSGAAAGEFGRRYLFSSGSTVKDSEEYLVSMASLRRLAEARGLDLVMSKNFHQYAYEQFLHPEAPELLEKFRVPPALNRDEWEVSRNYRAVVFRKRRSAKRKAPGAPDR